MSIHKSKVLNNATELMLFYAPIRFGEVPPAMPASFPCIAILFQSGEHPTKPFVDISDPPKFRHCDESIGYVYVDDFTESTLKPRKSGVKRAAKPSKAKGKRS